MRRTPLRRKSQLKRRPPGGPARRPKKVHPVRDLKEENWDLWFELRTILLLRSGYECERCGCRIEWTTFDAHHRKLRSAGGSHDIRNLVALCKPCHTGSKGVHSRVAQARIDGFIVPSFADFSTRPVSLHDGRTVLLTEGGGYDPVPFPDREETA